MDHTSLQSPFDSSTLASPPTCFTEETSNSLKMGFDDHEKYVKAKKLKKNYQRQERVKELKKYHQRLLHLMKKRSKKYFKELERQSIKFFESQIEEEKKKDMLHDEKARQNLVTIVQGLKQENRWNNFDGTDFQNQLFREFKRENQDCKNERQIGNIFITKMQKCCKIYARSMFDLKNQMIKYLQK